MVYRHAWFRGVALAAAVVAVIGLASAAKAGTQTHGPASFGPVSTDWSETGFLVLPQFDQDTYGTLLSVELIVSGNSDGGSVEFTVSGSGNKTLGIGSSIQVTGPSALVVLAQPTNSQLYTGLNASDVVTLFGVPTNDTQSDVLTSGLSPYIGLGTVSFDLFADGYFSAAGSAPGTTVDNFPTYDFEVTLIYTYIPEPASLALLGVGGVMMLRRRRA